LIVAADNPADPSVIRTTFSTPTRPRRCSVMNPITSREVTSAGSLATTVKKTFRSCA
jgi:hypothetical protein